MKVPIVVTILLLAIAACAPAPSEPVSTVNGLEDIILTAPELQNIGMTTNGSDCIVETYNTSEYSSLAQYSMCTYNITALNTEVITQLYKFTNGSDLNGSYQYNSLHYFSVDGLISENTYGDQSRFRVNSVNDYGGEFNNPNITYYHLWTTKDLYLIHITSAGSKDAKSYLEEMATRMLAKFE